MNTHCIVAFLRKGLFISLALLLSLVVLSCASLWAAPKTRSSIYADSTYTVPKPGVLAHGKGGVIGRVIEAKTGEGFSNAKVTIIDTKLVTFTDSVGKYQINNIPPGIYTVQSGFIGYHTLNKTGVRIRPGKLKHLILKLELIIPGF